MKNKNISIKNIIIASISITIFELIFSMFTCGWLFNWVYQLEPINVWKPIEEVYMVTDLVLKLFMSFIFVIVYALIKNGIPGKSKYTKGLVFGLIVWALGMLPGMLSTYTFMVVNSTVVIYWTFWGLILIPLKGIITSSIYGK